MSVPMKKRHIEVIIQSDRKQRFIVPREKLRPLLILIKEFSFKPSEKSNKDLIPWREVAKDNLKKYGESAVMLRGARYKEGYTQVQLAKKLGITQYNLSKMENGKRPIGKKMAQRLAKALKVDYRIFL